MRAANMKKIRALRYMLSDPGKIAIRIAFNTFMIIPEAPFPNITAPIYFSGSIDAIPNTYPWIMPLTTPKNNRTAKQLQKAVPGSSLPWARNGKHMVSPAARRNPTWTLNWFDRWCPYTIIITWVTDRNPFTANG